MLDINFNQIIEMIEKRKNNAYRKVNEKMILLYLEVGKFLYKLKENSNYNNLIRGYAYQVHVPFTETVK